jgi:hypothetical protein
MKVHNLAHLKGIAICFMIFLSWLPLFPQTSDLMVKQNGDSLACHIDSITDTHIYFEAKFNGKWLHTYIGKDAIVSVEMGVINKRQADFKPGSSILKPYSPEAYTGKRNNIYGTAGFLGLWIVGEINYERLIMGHPEKFFNSLWFRVSGGGFAGWEISGPLGVTGVTLLTGKRNSHLEVNLGIAALFDKVGFDIEERDAQGGYGSDPSRIDYLDISPAGGVAYRYQKPGGTFIFRVGFSFPETACLSFGLQF